MLSYLALLIITVFLLSVLFRDKNSKTYWLALFIIPAAVLALYGLLAIGEDEEREKCIKTVTRIYSLPNEKNIFTIGSGDNSSIVFAINNGVQTKYLVPNRAEIKYTDDSNLTPRHEAVKCRGAYQYDLFLGLYIPDKCSESCSTDKLVIPKESTFN